MANFNSLKSFFSELAKSGMADDVAKFATNYGDDAVKTLGVLDDIPAVNYINPSHVGMYDDVLSDSTSRLGKFIETPTFGTSNGSFHELAPDLNATVSVPNLPLDDLVFAQHAADPTVVSVRPHKNTALGRWFEQQAANIQNTADPITSSKFVNDYTTKRLNDIAERNKRFKWLYQTPDNDLPL